MTNRCDRKFVTKITDTYLEQQQTQHSELIASGYFYLYIKVSIVYTNEDLSHHHDVLAL